MTAPRPRRAFARSTTPPILAAAMLALLSGCSDDDDGNGGASPSLTGQAWVWDGARAFPDAEVEPVQSDYTVTFSDGGSFSGNTDCRPYRGTWLSTGGTMLETMIDNTGPQEDVICDGSIYTFYLNTFAMASTYAIEGDRLSINAADGATLLYSIDPEPN